MFATAKTLPIGDLNKSNY